MSTKLCFSCFAELDIAAEQCDNCGVLITDEIKIASRLGGKIQSVNVEIDYNDEIERLETIRDNHVGDQEYYARVRKRDLYRISIITSILGILQIFTAGLLDSINEISIIFDEGKFIDGQPLMISGFLYFIGILGFYYRFNNTRRIFLLGNIIHLWILFRVYDTLSLFTYILRYRDTSNIPIQLKDFLDDIVLLQYLMFAFALLYVVQIFYMYRRELQTLRYGNQRGR